MTVIVVAGLLGLAVVGGWVWRLRRDVAGLRAGLDQRAAARVDAHARAAWEDLCRSQDGHARAVEVRVRRAEQAAARIATGHVRLDERLEVVESWVRHWSRQG